MKNGKKTVALFLTALMLAALCPVACRKPLPLLEQTAQRTADEAADDTIPDNVCNLEDIIGENGETDCEAALYADYCNNFAEMEDISLLIVYGRVRGVKPASDRKLAQEAEVEILATYKGKTYSTIRLFQLYDNAVEEGGEYLLFLGSQYPDDEGSNVFYTVGGCQGSIELNAEGENVKFCLNSAAIYDDDFAAWVDANLSDLIGGYCAIYAVGNTADRNADRYGEYEG